MKPTLPDFIIIGAMKAGTSSLHNYLDEHPDIYVPKEKELDFFIKEKNYKRGINWFKKQFNSLYKFNGYASPNYTKRHIFNGVAERIYQTIPGTKLIFIVRNPIDRFISHYHHVRMNNLETRSLDEIFANVEENDCYLTSLYYYQLKSYLVHFSKSQILVITSENLLYERDKTMKEVLGFIGADTELNLNFKYETHITSKRGIKPKLISNLLRSKTGTRIKFILPPFLKNFIARIVEKKISYPKLSQIQRKILTVKFKEDTQQLTKEIGIAPRWFS